jgi:hypothetical protein
MKTVPNGMIFLLSPELKRTEEILDGNSTERDVFLLSPLENVLTTLATAI